MQGILTVTELMSRSVERGHLSAWLIALAPGFGDRQAQGTRPLLSWKKDEGYRFPAKAIASKIYQKPKVACLDQVFGETQWRTYKEFGALCKARV